MERGPEISSDIAEACQQYRATYVPGFSGPDDDGDRPSCETCEYWSRGRCGDYQKALQTRGHSFLRT